MLGGKYEPDNFRIYDVVTHFRVWVRSTSDSETSRMAPVDRDHDRNTTQDSIASLNEFFGCFSFDFSKIVEKT